MESFGGIIRDLRIKKKLPLRSVAAYLDIDQAVLSKIERGQRKASKSIVIKLADYFNTDKDNLLIAWISDSISNQLENEDVAIEALQVAEEKVLYKHKKNTNRDSVIKTISDFFKQDGRVSKAWIFGSFARGEYTNESDIDIMVIYSDRASGTLFDYADIKFHLENQLKMKVDLVEEGFIKSFAKEHINRDKILIHG